MESIKKQKAESEKSSKSNRKILFWLLGIVVIVIIVMFQPVVDYINYYNAINTMKNGKYEQAIEIFEKTKNKDSIEKIEECRYLMADELLVNGEYESAEDIFKTLATYRDVDEKIVKCEYEKAKEFISEKNYLQAINILSNLGEYQDAEEQLVNCINQKAKEYVENGNIQNAIDLYIFHIEKYPKEIAEGLYEIAQLYVAQEEYYDAVKVLTMMDVSEDKETEDLLDTILEQYYEYFYNKAEIEYRNANFEVASECYKYAQKKGYKLPEGNNSYNNEFMLSIQGEYFLEESIFSNAEITDSNRVTIKGFTITGSGLEHTIVPMKREFSVYRAFVGVFQDDSTHFLRKSINHKGEIEIWHCNERGDFLSEVLRDERRQNAVIYEQKNKEIPQQKKEPAIGMTTSEVRNSTWGEPIDINKTTYEWGTTEQWCYPNYKYIYFDDGIVTAISE